MKKKLNNYQVIYTLFLLFSITCIVGIVKSYHTFYKVYRTYSATVTTKNTLEFIIEDDTYHKLNKNKEISIKGKIYRIKIQKIIRNIMEKEKEQYHQITITTIAPLDKYDLLEVITITIYDKKKSLISIFESCWKGEKNEKDGTNRIRKDNRGSKSMARRLSSSRYCVCSRNNRRTSTSKNL